MIIMVWRHLTLVAVCRISRHAHCPHLRPVYSSFLSPIVWNVSDAAATQLPPPCLAYALHHCWLSFVSCETCHGDCTAVTEVGAMHCHFSFVTNNAVLPHLGRANRRRSFRGAGRRG